MAIVIAAAAAGSLITMLAGTEPGLVLGLFVVAGTVAAGLAVRPRAIYLIIPVPALAYLAAAIVPGLVSSQTDSASHAALAVSAAQWIASGFRPMTAATAIAIALAAGRWPRSRPVPRRAGPGA